MSSTTGFELDGQLHQCHSDKELLIEALRVLGSRHPAALDRLVEEYSYDFRERHYVARSRDSVYCKRLDLIHYVEEFLPGYFVGTNENSDTKLELLMRLCYFANLEYGTQFRAACLEGDGERRRKLERGFEISRRLGWHQLGL